MNGREIHHRIPRSLLRLYDVVFWEEDGNMLNDPDTALHRAMVELEDECSRYGIDAHEVSRGMLEKMIKESEIELSWQQHRHEAHAGDWSRWGRRGGLRVLELYGKEHFRALAMKRWSKQ